MKKEAEKEHQSKIQETETKEDKAEKEASQQLKLAHQAAKKKLKKKRKLLLQLCKAAMETLDVDPKDKVVYYEYLNDISDAAKVATDLDKYCSAFGKFISFQLCENSSKNAGVSR